MPAEQRKLKLWLPNTSNVIRRCDLKRLRKTILHAMRRKARTRKARTRKARTCALEDAVANCTIEGCAEN